MALGEKYNSRVAQQNITTWVSKLFMAKGHTRYCELFGGQHVE
jgi:hypothetical protein